MILKNLSVIFAESKNKVIGKNNSLPWYIPEELQRFKELTSGHSVVMGRKTYQSIGKILPNRENIVLTSKKNIHDEVIVVHSLDELINMIQMNQHKQYFIIGGHSVYEQLIPLAKYLIISSIDFTIDGNVYAPKIDFDDWFIVNSVAIPNKMQIKITQRFYEHKKH